MISSIESRIDYYANIAGITNKTEIKEYKKNIKDDNLSMAKVLYIKRTLESIQLSMGEKRTTESLYLERDLEVLNDVLGDYKKKGRNFVNVMKEEPKVLVKTNSSSYK